ncbi:MAG: hypothetical protein AAF514_14475, partial [Verrucomicrobiota bacterium]
PSFRPSIKMAVIANAGQAGAPIKADGSAPAKKAGGKKPGETVEKKLEPASIKLVKQHYDDKEMEEAGIAMRRLWRQFPNLDRSRMGMVVYSNQSNNRFAWPSDVKRPVSRTTTVKSSAKGGLEALLARTPPVIPGQSSVQQATNRQPSLFEAVGAEPFAAEEMERWLRTMSSREYQGQAFEEMATALARERIARDGVEKVIADALVEADEGQLSQLDQHVFLGVLELNPEAGGEEVSSYLHGLVDQLDPSDQWKALRLARCFAKRGDETRSWDLISWCGGNLGVNPDVSYGSRARSSNPLVQEKPTQLEGEARVKALETVLGLMTVSDPSPDTSSAFDYFVLSTWGRELPAGEVFGRCEDVCRRSVENYNAVQYPNRTLLELATLFLAAGGDHQTAFKGFETMVVPKVETKGTGRQVYMSASGGFVVYSSVSASAVTRRMTTVSDPLLLRLFPQDMKGWENPDAWLLGVVERVLEWVREDRLPNEDAVRVLALAALRLQENGYAPAALETLDKLKEIARPLTNEGLWLADAARLCDRKVLALEIEKDLLEEGRLPLARIPDLLTGLAGENRVEEAVALGERAAEFTWRPDVLQAMVTLARNADKLGVEAVWREHQQELLQLDAKPERFGFVVGEGDAARLYRYEEIENETLINDSFGDQTLVLSFSSDEREVRAWERGARTFVLQEDGTIVDDRGRPWDLQVGLCRASGAGQERLTPVALDLVESQPWRAAHPDNEVYLISMIEKATTRLIKKGAKDWKYFDDFPPEEGWEQPSFEDSEWNAGKAPLGYGESGITTTLTYGGDPNDKNPSVYFRKKIEIEDPEGYLKLVGRIRVDDGAVVYVNGEEADRVNMPEGPIEPKTNATQSANEGRYEVFLAPASLLKKGENTVAVRIHQHDADSSDLFFDLELSVLTKSDLEEEEKEKGAAKEEEPKK